MLAAAFAGDRGSHLGVCDREVILEKAAAFYRGGRSGEKRQDSTYIESGVREPTISRVRMSVAYHNSRRQAGGTTPRRVVC
jgi:hypothetical protein